MKNTLSKDDKEKSGVYQIENIINNKKYVGSAVNFYKRYHEHINNLLYNKHHSIRLQRSYNKHGKESFIFSIIELCSIELLLIREQYWMDFHKSYLPEFGYNISKIAGNSFLGRKHSEEAKEKMREIGKRKPINPKAIRAMQLANTGRKNPEYAKHMSETFSKPVMQLTLNGEFVKEWKSSTEATLSFGVNANDSNIAACTRGKCRSARGFLWVKKKDYDPTKEYKYINNQGKTNWKVIYQYSLEGILIREWENTHKAAKELSVDSTSIYNCLCGKSKTCKGFKWYRNKI